ncbi:hypothetical protein LTR10_001208 [Elasticomyces elasticus]|nr:hypothetical protein LTR10_001208 [Elasticomyces elasticus]KAK4965426.1 hypothetical protein LTR42_012182 [Elasticomyces elasticus]
MRLLDTHTLELHEFTQPPVYAILSHRWSNEEVTYEDYSLMQRAARRSTSKDFDEQISEIRRRPGLRKIEECCRYARTDHQSTLQELLAPRDLFFCDSNWDNIGILRKGLEEHTDQHLVDVLSKFTSIPSHFLMHKFTPQSTASVAQKMSWMAHRITSRIEDMAYCLLGLFGIHMTPLYGEGRQAFIRLQKQILQQTDDESIFAWSVPCRLFDSSGANADPIGCRTNCFRPHLLAKHPKSFHGCGNVEREVNTTRLPYQITNKGLMFIGDAALLTTDLSQGRQSFIIFLHCRDVRSEQRCAIALRCEMEGVGPAGCHIAVGREYGCDINRAWRELQRVPREQNVVDVQSDTHTSEANQPVPELRSGYDDIQKLQTLRFYIRLD